MVKSIWKKTHCIRQTGKSSILASPQVGVLLKGTNVTMDVAGNGTTLTVFNGSVLVDSIAVDKSHTEIYHA